MSKLDTGVQIMNTARSLGASLVGIASLDLIKKSPAHYIYKKIGLHKGVGALENSRAENFEIAWPTMAKSALVIALAHTEGQPHLDWWDGVNGTAGNRLLIGICEALSVWIEKECKISTHKMPYYIERGGIFLKDAAVIAGLGCIGKNNLLITPEFGPRIRLRALLLDEEIVPAEPIQFDPCDGCSEPCKQACPKFAFNRIIYSQVEIAIDALPSRNGCFNRALCNTQMNKDIKNGELTEEKLKDNTAMCIKYCRQCELACPIGK
jgi:epoxyqueuosine reductase